MDLGPAREIAWFEADAEQEKLYKQKFRALAPDARQLARMVLTILREADSRGAGVSMRHKALKSRAEAILRVLSQTERFGDDPNLLGMVPSADVAKWNHDETPRLLVSMNQMAEAAATYCTHLNADQLKMVKSDPRMSYVANVRGTALFPGIWSWRLQCDLGDVFLQASEQTRRSVRDWLLRLLGKSPLWLARADDPTEAEETAKAFISDFEADAYNQTPRETDGPFTIIMSDYVRQINERIVRMARLLEDTLFADLVAGPSPLAHAVFM